MRLIVPSHNVLGEGPCWSVAEGRLYWFDIKRAILHWHGPGSGTDGQFQLPMRASAAASCPGGLLLATERGLARFDSASGEVTLTQPMDFGPGFRSNDGKIDPQGRFWWSTMDDDGGRRPGAIFVTQANGRTERVIDGVHISNATSFTADGATLYLADSSLKTIFAYDTADLSHRRVFAKAEGAGAPDGAAMDSDGFLWNAEWGAGRIVRYAPDGSIDRIVEMPVEQPSCCAFGGPDLATLYVTSARDGLSDADLARQPEAGGLFAFEPGVTGQPLPVFAG
jgi:sugar lactone lactonase YvrE